MKERIKKVVSQVLKTDVDDNTSQNTCASWDSLHHLNLIVELETEFDISFEPEEIAIMKSIDAIERMIETKK
ncbi:MAG: acyl carrier protein [Bacteroidales bacterium]|jgi:acyl carrier protein|nr:acyl carrier protein [Bacteroidales bacterium]